jgi:hypothetical protein
LENVPTREKSWLTINVSSTNKSRGKQNRWEKINHCEKITSPGTTFKKATAAADTDAYMLSEVLSHSRARGVFAGVSLEDSTLRPDSEANRHLYGRPVTASQIIQESEVQAPAVANDLIGQLQKTSPKLKAS